MPAPTLRSFAMQAAFGILAGVLQLVATAPYLLDIRRGSTQPHRATWGIWATLSFVALASQAASGATWSLALTIGALRRGVGGLSPIDLAMLAIAALGIVGWQVADNPTVATSSVVLADLIGGALMLPKTYRNPGSETLSTYIVGVVSTLCAIAAVNAAPSLLVYPVYVLVADCVVVAVILLRRRAFAPVSG